MRTNVIASCLLLPSLYFMAIFFYVVLHRIHYPLELELIEGSPVNHALRILQGEPLYIKPAFEFTPNLYTPLFYYCAAAFSYVLGIGFFSLRLVSLCAVVATFVVIALFVYRETTSRVAAVTAVGLYAATYAASGGWMDLARVDSLFVALLLFAAYGTRYAKNTAGIMATAILFVLAFYSKQSALIATVPLMLYAILAPAPTANRFLLPFVTGTLLLLSLGLADWLTDRWFTYYTIVMPAGQPNNSNNAAEFWRHDLTLVMPIALFFSLFLIGQLLAKKLHKDALFFVMFLFAMALVSYLTRINKGGYYNNLMPIYAALAIVFGVFIGEVLKQAAMNDRRSVGLLIATLFAVIGQFWFLSYDPRSYIPKKEDWDESEQLLSDLRGIDGNIYGLDHGFIGYLVGKPNFSHGTSFGDIKLSRYQYWAETDLHLFVEQQMSMLSEGLDRNNVNALLLVNEKNSEAASRVGPFVLKKHYISMQHAQPWSAETIWVRPWPTRTMFLRPDMMLYIRE